MSPTLLIQSTLIAAVACCAAAYLIPPACAVARFLYDALCDKMADMRGES